LVRYFSLFSLCSPFSFCLHFLIWRLLLPHCLLGLADNLTDLLLTFLLGMMVAQGGARAMVGVCGVQEPSWSCLAIAAPPLQPILKSKSFHFRKFEAHMQLWELTQWDPAWPLPCFLQQWHLAKLSHNQDIDMTLPL
jgi:hypothetical protein